MSIGEFGHPQLIDVPAAEPLFAAAGSGPEGGEQLLLRLEAHVASAPNDARAWVMLARARMQRDQFEPAALAYRRALDASAKVARDPLIWCEYADALGMTQGGALAGKPTELIGRALAIDGRNAKALEMAGSAAYERSDFRMAATYWKDLLAQMPPGTPTYAELATAIQRAERRAALSLPPSAAATPGG